MAYRKVSKEEFMDWARKNPGKAGMVNGQEVQAPMPQAQDLGFLGNLVRGVTKPLRSVAAMPEYLVQALGAANKGQTGFKPGQFQSIFLTPEEELAWGEDPIKQGVKSSLALGAYLVPGGGGTAKTALGRVGTAAGRGTISGTMSGYGLSGEEDELKSTLTGGALGFGTGAVLQGVSEGAQALAQRKAQASGEVINTMNVDEIVKLPDRTRKGLAKQAKSAGFWDSKVSESKNIQNYLQNRGLAGNTPAETLENLTQEFNRAQQLKQQGLDEVGGLSRGYLEQVKDNLDEAIMYKGIGLDPEATRVYNDIVKTLEKGPTGAKDLDNIIMKWNEAGRLAKGAQKTSTAGLYADAARELRNVMRSTSPTYDSALQALNQILGIEDVGLVGKTAADAARAGVDIPLFAGAGFHGADIKTPFISDMINKTRAAQGRALEQGTGALAGVGQAASQVAPVVSQAAQVGQRAIPALPAMLGQGQPEQGTEQMGMQPGMQPDIYGQMAPQGPQIDEMALIEAVLSGKISTSEADWLMEMLGGGGEVMPTTESGRKFWFAKKSADNILQMLDQTGPLAGPLQGVRTGLTSAVGIADEQTALKNEIEAMRSIVFNALGGAQLTPNEQRQYEKFIPKVTDTKAQVRQKLQTLMPKLEGLMGTSSEPQNTALYEMGLGVNY
jgi:hypothetical protein